ncbi:GNAT family N-acetyltransferase [Lactococcus laudensis]|uniref:GNAT family N-acetyltransferase n=1 Tax=Pseudolactococcus laudensis TaxID=1494461 RepID=A0A7V8N0J8_9LACT|nr:GNAT family N-acetyltransferase [Lactococcus laudensis]MBA0016421.1 GNAT family N-acetyltransferase [Lactococcus laudensis]MBW9281029.1 GNAT family N-acetyltransferase [Lactococcus laudensis]
MTEIIVREAEPKDAQKLINFLNQVGKESHFLTLDEVGILMTATQMSEYLAQIAEKDNNAYLLAIVNDEIAGVISLTADFHERIRHIGDLFIAVSQNFQGYGIGHILMADMLEFIQEIGVIKRLELQVQKRNERAIHLYQKNSFEIESIRKFGARDELGNLIDVLEMVRFFD